jgi:hypothetical protein
MATKNSLAEQVLLMLTDGRPDQVTGYDIRDIMLAVVQAISEITKAQYYSGTLPSGETIPNGTMMATYEAVATETWKGRSRATLPALPINLPRGMGVFEIANNTDPFIVYIPAMPGQMAMLAGSNMVGALSNLVVYEQRGMYIEFNGTVATGSILMRLLVTDVNTLSDNAPLPIPTDYESLVVDMVYKRMGGRLPTNKDSDLVTNNIAQK